MKWLGALQSQDYAGAKWALGLRLRAGTDNDIEQAFTDGSILRTHLMRPTWHFVTPADIRWMLALTAPRVNAISAYYYRKLELDQKLQTRSNDAIAAALQGGRQLTREELGRVLQHAGIVTTGSLRLGYIMLRAELDGIVCSGPRRGKQFTYALLDERVTKTRTLERDEALAELVKRYFVSHGPATVQDFVWWSGLTTADARNGLEMVNAQLAHSVIDSRTYWFSKAQRPRKVTSPKAYLLPNYDEYISYKDRSAVFDMAHLGDLIFSHLMVINGRIAGTWKRTLKKKSVMIETSSFTSLTVTERHVVAEAANRYGDFLVLPVMLV